MTILDALQSGPLPAEVIASRIGQDITDTYALLVSAEARGEVRVITTYRAGMWRGQWESMQ